MRVSGIVTFRRDPQEEEVYEDFSGSIEELKEYLQRLQRLGYLFPEFINNDVSLHARLISTKLEWYIPAWLRSHLGGPYEALPIS